jgi:hypothetical protein
LKDSLRSAQETHRFTSYKNQNLCNEINAVPFVSFRIHPLDLTTSGQETFEIASRHFVEEILLRETRFGKTLSLFCV